MCVWVKGRYILVLDDIAADKEVEVTWLVQGPKIEAGEGGRFTLKNDTADCPMQIVAEPAMAGAVGKSTADNHGKTMGLDQAQLKAKTARLRVASVYDPWHKGSLTVALKPAGDAGATVTVTGPGVEDAWTWKAAPDNKTPSSLEGKGAEGKTVTFGPADKTPLP